MSDNKDKRIGFLLERTTRLAKLSFTKAFKDLGVDITPEQWIVLDILNNNGSLSQKDIGKRSYKNAPTISRIIDNLVNKNLVSRVIHKVDRRKASIQLTDAGHQVIAQCQEEVDKIRTLSWDGLDDDDYDTFRSLLDKIFDNFESYH